MKTIAILANGQFPRKEYPLYLLKSADAVVCCDGALVAAEKHGIVPDAVAGDLDSVCRRALSRFEKIKSVTAVARDSDQETNDLTKTVKYVLGRWPDAGTIHILGATGKSEAHTIGNVSLLMEYEERFGLADKGISLDIISDYSTIFAITDGGEFHVGEGRKVSIFSPDPTLNVQSEGLVWPTGKVVFDNWWKASLNRASADVVKLKFNHKSKAIIILD